MDILAVFLSLGGLLLAEAIFTVGQSMGLNLLMFAYGIFLVFECCGLSFGIFSRASALGKVAAAFALSLLAGSLLLLS